MYVVVIMLSLSTCSNGFGDWSTEGIDVVNDTITTNGNYTRSNVVCRINHLTPFVVLVDVHDIQVCDMYNINHV